MKIRTRAIRGTMELQKLGYGDGGTSGVASLAEVVKQVVRRPSLWLQLSIYVAISTWVRAKVALAGKYSDRAWERDESSRGLT